MTLAGKEIDVSRSVIPVVAALALMVLVAGAAFTIGSVLSNFQSRSDQFRVELTGIQADLAAIRGQVAALMSRWPGTDRWTHSDHVRFCLRAERANRDWKCPDALLDTPVTAP